MKQFNPQIAPEHMDNIRRAFDDLVDADRVLKKTYRKIKIRRYARNVLVAGGACALYYRRKNRK
jgi:hypothetical protein